MDWDILYFRVGVLMNDLWKSMVVHLSTSRAFTLQLRQQQSNPQRLVQLGPSSRGDETFLLEDHPLEISRIICSNTLCLFH